MDQVRTYSTECAICHSKWNNSRRTSGIVRGNRSTHLNPSFFFVFRLNRPATCDGQERQGEHRQGDMAIPTRPMAYFILIQTDLRYAQFKTLFNRPTLSSNHDQRLQRRARRRKDDIIREFTIVQTASHQQAMFDVRRLSPAGQIQQRPVVETWSFGPITAT